MLFVVCTSLTIGTLSVCLVTLWIPLHFSFDYSTYLRAMPPITLVAGYMLPFFEWNLWGVLPTTIIVVGGINIFALWMLLLFQNIPKELDEN